MAKKGQGYKQLIPSIVLRSNYFTSLLTHFFSFKRQIHCPRVILHINLFFSFLIFSSLQLFKDFTWINNLGFPKDVIEIPHNPGQYRTNENVLVKDSQLHNKQPLLLNGSKHIFTLFLYI